MSNFITATYIDSLSKVTAIVKSNGLGFSGVYPTNCHYIFIASTWCDDVYQTVNIITREIEPTTQADFREFVEGQR